MIPPNNVTLLMLTLSQVQMQSDNRENSQLFRTDHKIKIRVTVVNPLSENVHSKQSPVSWCSGQHIHPSS